MSPSTPSIQVDTRPMAPLNRHALVTWTFDQFEADKSGLFSWEYLDSGPEVWRIALTKRKGQHGVSHCCGACGG